MTLRPCIECGTPNERAHCNDCRPPRPAKKSARGRGYSAQWDKLSKRARRLQPFCLDCGSTTDLQSDHTPAAWARVEAGKPVRLRDIDVLCGPCNRARGAARGSHARTGPRGGDPSTPAPDPLGESKFGSHTPGGYA